jgi:hypothetical protein
VENTANTIAGLSNYNKQLVGAPNYEGQPKKIDQYHIPQTTTISSSLSSKKRKQFMTRLLTS